jgi:hypothetical protein
MVGKEVVTVAHTITRAVRYLDLDDDGLPDAVLVTETWPDDVDLLGDGRGATVVETLERGIGIDGEARDVSVYAHH